MRANSPLLFILKRDGLDAARQFARDTLSVRRKQLFAFGFGRTRSLVNRAAIIRSYADAKEFLRNENSGGTE